MGADPPPLQRAACTLPMDLNQTRGGGGVVHKSPTPVDSTKVQQHDAEGLTVNSFAAGGKLPQNQSQSVHVYPQEGISVEVNGPLQDLGGHVPPGPHLTVNEKSRLMDPTQVYQSHRSNVTPKGTHHHSPEPVTSCCKHP